MLPKNIPRTFYASQTFHKSNRIPNEGVNINFQRLVHKSTIKSMLTANVNAFRKF